eukprot:UN02834
MLKEQKCNLSQNLLTVKEPEMLGPKQLLTFLLLKTFRKTWIPLLIYLTFYLWEHTIMTVVMRRIHL